MKPWERDWNAAGQEQAKPWEQNWSGEEADAAGTDAEAVKAAGAPATEGEDDWASAAKKWVPNIASRWKGQAGGALEKYGDTDQAALEKIADAGKGEPGLFSRLSSAGEIATDLAGRIPELATRYFSKDTDNAVKAARSYAKEKGGELFDEAQSELQANQVNPGDNDLLRYTSMAVESGLGSMAPTIATTLITKNPNIGLGLMGTQVYGEKYAEQVRKGRTKDQASTDAMVYALSEALTEKVPLDVLLKPGSGFLGRVFKGGLAEGGQEMINEAIQMAYDAGALDDIPRDEDGNVDVGAVLRRIADAGIVGSMIGTGSAVATHPFVRGQDEDAAGKAAPSEQGEDGLNAGDVENPVEPVGDAQGRRTLHEGVAGEGAPMPWERDWSAENNRRLLRADVAGEKPMLRDGQDRRYLNDGQAAAPAAAGPGPVGEPQGGRRNLADPYRYEGGIDWEKPELPEQGLDAELLPSGAPLAEKFGDIEFTLDEPVSVPDLGIENDTQADHRVAQDKRIAEQQRQLGQVTRPEGITDPRLGRLQYRGALRQMAKDLVKGGGIAVVPDETQTMTTTEGSVSTGSKRTPSLNPEWFKAISANPDLAMSTDEVKATVDKALAGENLGVRQARVIGHMLDTHSGERGQQVDYAKAQLEDARTNRRAIRYGFAPVEAYNDYADNAGEVFDESEYHPEWSAGARSIYELMSEAGKYNPDQAEAIVERLAKEQITEQDAARQLWAIMSENANEQTEQRVPAGAGQVQAGPQGSARTEEARADQGVTEEVTVEPHGEKSIIAKGDKDAIRSRLAESGVPTKGLWNAKHRGLVFSNKHEAAVREALAGGRRTHQEPVAKEQRSGKDRRQNNTAREYYDSLSRDELLDELLKHELTGIKGRRAFVREHGDAGTIVSIDADSLKWINDNMSPQAGDRLLQEVADALVEEFGYDYAYHISGDEFYVVDNGLWTVDDINESMANVQKRLNQAILTEAKADGSVITKKGLAATHGIGQDRSSADAALKREKVAREQRGERAGRGEVPPGVSRHVPGVPAAAGAGQHADGDHAAAGSERTDSQAESGAAPEGDGTGAPDRQPEGDSRRDAAPPTGQVTEPTPTETPASAGVSVSEIDEAAHQAATSPQNNSPEPTDAQKQAGNYKVGRISLHGLDISIENPRGSKRSGTSPDGARWESEMANHYGYIRGTEGKDGDHVDVFLTDGAEDAGRPVFVIDQVDPKTRRFDEHKVIIGTATEQEARDAYLANYEQGWDGIGGITRMSLDDFKAWLKDGDSTKRLTKENEPQQKSQSPTNSNKISSSDEKQATDILNAAKVTGRDRLDIMAKFRAGEYSLQDLKEAYPAVSAEQSQEQQKIEDFGEKIEGARKDVWQTYAKKMQDAKDEDIASVPFAKSWPEPDYQKMLDEGADPWVVAFIRAARDEVPAKPRAGWKVRSWAKQVETLRELVMSTLERPEYAAKIKAELPNNKTLEAWAGRVELYTEIGHGLSLKGVTFRKHHYALYEGEKNVDRWTVERPAKASAFSNWPQEMAAGKTHDEALANFKRAVASGEFDKVASKRHTTFEIYSYRAGEKQGKWVVGKKVGKDYVDLETFDTVKEAREYRDNNQSKLEEKLSRFKEIPAHRKESNSPRIGVDHRNGADVTPEQFHEAFGFRGVQFGNYVEQGKRQQDLNEAYDAMMDLAGIIGVPARALSLNGELGLAFGARGKGAAGREGGITPSAHYEPGEIVINLTKMSGAGSLAHEWFHSLDSYFSRARQAKSGFLSELTHERGEGVRPEIVEAFKQIVQAINGSKLKQRSAILDKARSKEYWSTGREMFARAFESYVIEKLKDQNQSNDYLANIVSPEYWEAAAKLGLEKEESYPYPEAAEIPAIRAAFDNFFRVVETKETEKGVALFAFAGERARTADKYALANAQQQLKAGRSAETVRRDHGWFVGADGMWRFEIPDNEAKLKIGVTQEDEDRALSLAYQDTVYEEKGGWVTATHAKGTKDHVFGMGDTKEEAMANLVDNLAKRLSGNPYQSLKSLAGNTLRLGEILHHPKLFAAYHDLGRMNISFRDGIDGYLGMYRPGSDTIEIDISRGQGDVLSTLLHELQHAIQEREGFASGGNVNPTFTEAVKNAIVELEGKAKARVEAWIDRNTDKISEAEKAADIARNALMYESAQRLIDYSRRDKPSGVFRLIRNEMQWLYDSRFYGNREASDLQRLFYDIPKRHRTQERNEFLRNMAFDAGRFLLDHIPQAQREQFKNDTRTMRGMIKALEREAQRRRETLSPLTDLRSQARMASTTAETHRFSMPHQVYSALYGEVEARNTQARMMMSEEERMETSPLRTQDVPSQDVIVMFGGMDIQAPVNMASVEAPGVYRGTAETGLPVSEVEAIAAKMALSWGGNARTIHVHNSVDGMPERLSRQVAQGDEGEVQGVHDPVTGDVHLIADNLPTKRDVHRILGHEMAGHTAMEEIVDRGDVIKGGWQAVERRLDTLVKAGDKQAKSLHDEVSARGYDMGNRTTVTKEMLAIAVERHITSGPIGKLITRIRAAIRNLLRKAGINSLLPSADIDAMVIDSLRYLKGSDNQRTTYPNTLEHPQLGEIDVKVGKGRTGASKFADAAPEVAAELEDLVAGAKLVRRDAESATLENDGNTFHLIKENGRWVLTDAVNDEMRQAEGEPMAANLARRPADNSAVNLRDTLERRGEQLAEAFDKFRYEAQDKHIYLKRMQEAIGGITEETDAYGKEELYHGRVRYQIDQFHDGMIKLMLELISRSGRSLEEVEEYLHARHAEEANAALREINDSDRPGYDSLSGMTDEEARRIKAKYKDDRIMRAIGIAADRIGDFQLAMLEQNGLESSEYVQAARSKYQHYVPLKRETEPFEVQAAGPSKGTGYNVAKSFLKRRAGSNRAVENILPNLIAQAETTIINAEKAKVHRAIYQLAEENPDPSFWELDTTKKRYTTDKNGNVRLAASPFDKEADNALRVRIDGEDYVIRFNTQNEHAMKMVAALRNMDQAQAGILVRTGLTLNRYLSAINTGFNPEFIISNAARDIQTAVYNLSSTEAEGITKRMVKDWPKAFAGIRSALRKDGSHEWSKHFDEFREAGAMTGWLEHTQTIDDFRKKLNQEITGLGNSRKAKAKRGIRKALDLVEDYNMVVENAVRLSAFVNARRAGLSKSQAARIAKNLTVNFNRRGNKGVILNGMYLFYNASIQGSARLLQTVVTSKKGRRLALATIGFAVMMDLLNRSVGGDDDDDVPWYDKIDESVKERNLIFMDPFSDDGNYYKFPLPWGYNVFHVIGQKTGKGLYAAANPDSPTAMRTGMNDVADILVSVANAFNPIGGGTLTQTLSPTVMDPIVQLAENKSWTGNDLMPQDMFGQASPDSQKAWRSTPQAYKDVAEWLNEVSGGNAARSSGMLDISPETLQLMYDTATGGLGRFVTGTIDTVQRIVDEDLELEAANVPLVRKVTGSQNRYADQALFYDRAAEVHTVQEELDLFRGKPEYAEIMEKHGDKRRLIGMLKITEKRLKVLRKRYQRAFEADNKEAIEKLDKEMWDAYKRFNQRYDRVVDSAP